MKSKRKAWKAYKRTPAFQQAQLWASHAGGFSPSEVKKAFKAAFKMGRKA